MQGSNASRSRPKFARDSKTLRIVWHQNAHSQRYWRGTLKFSRCAYGDCSISRNYANQYILMGENSKNFIQTKTISRQVASGRICKCSTRVDQRECVQINYLIVRRATTRIPSTFFSRDATNAKTFGRNAWKIMASSVARRSKQHPDARHVFFHGAAHSGKPQIPICLFYDRYSSRKSNDKFRFSTYRYSGKTQKQIIEFVRDNYVKRQTFQR